MKNNDFIVASLNNPEYTSDMFEAIGMDITNTQMLDKLKYLNSSFIQNQDIFKDDSGNFSESKFNQYYDLKLSEWNAFSKNSSPALSYDLFDYRRFNSPQAKTKNPGLLLSRESNPFEITIGEGLIDKSYESPLSIRELALKNKVLDYETGTERDYSLNEHSLEESPFEWFKDLFREPLVLATYDEDTEGLDPITGERKRYKKGDYKLNSQGKLYYENLGGRSSKDKEIFSHWDNLTIDGSALNEIDLMDSDSKELSVAKLIGKTALEVAPMLYGGVPGLVYSCALVGREILKSLPMLDGILGSVTNSDTPFTRLANNLGGIGQSFMVSSTDAGRQNPLGLEALANTMVDVALQWGQLKVIAEAVYNLNNPELIMKNAEKTAESLYKIKAAQLTLLLTNEAQALRNAGKIAEAEATLAKIAEQVGEANKWKESIIGAATLREASNLALNKIQQAGKLGEKLSLMYMVGISNTDVYQDAVDAGLSKREATLVTLGSMFGMYHVDSSLHLGETFFKWMTPENEKAIRATLANSSDDWIKALAKNTKYIEKASGKMASLRNLFRTGAEKGSSMLKTFWENAKHHTGGLIQNAVSEGLEEVGEEVAADLSKQIFELAGEIAPSIFTKADLHSWDNFGERAMQSFIGGALGGGLFYGVEAFKGEHKLRDTSKDQLIYLFNNNDKATVDKILDEMHDKGLLGSKDLGYKQVKQENGEYTFVTADENNISQNDFVYNNIKSEIDSIYKIVKDSDTQMSDGQMYDMLTMGDIRLMRLAEVLKDSGYDYQKGLIARYNDLQSKYVDVRQQIDTLKANLPDSPSSELKAEFTKETLKLEDKADELLTQLLEFKSGKNAIDYAGRMLFEMDDRLSAPFMNTVTFKSFLQNKYDITAEEFNKLDLPQKEHYINEYASEKHTQDIEQAWRLYKDIRDLLTPEFVDILDKALVLRDYYKKMQELVDPKKNPLANIPIVDIESFSEDATDINYRIDYGVEMPEEHLSAIDKEKVLHDKDDDWWDAKGISKEDRDTFRLTRLNNLKAIAKNKKEQELTIEAFRKVEDILNNVGNVLDNTTKRHILLTLGVRQKDIINEKLYLTLFKKLFQELGDSYDLKIKDVKADLSNLDDIVNELKMSKSKLLHKLAIKNAFILKDLGFKNYDNITKDSVRDALILKLDYINQYIDVLRSYDLIIETPSADPTLPGEIKLDLSKLKVDANIEDGVTNINDAKKTLLSLLDLDTPGSDLSIADILFLNNGDGKVLIYSGDLTFDVDQSSNFRNKVLESFVSKNYEYNGEELTNDYYNSEDIINLFNQYNDLNGEIDYDYIAYQLNGGDDFNIKDNVSAVLSSTNPSDLTLDAWAYTLLTMPEEYSDLIETVYNSFVNFEGTTPFTRAAFLLNIDSKTSYLHSQVNSDETYKFINTIRSARNQDNPIIKIINKLGLSLNKDSSNVEEFLQTMMDQDMSEKGVDEFTLSEEQRRTLNEAYDFLELGKAFIYSTFNSKSTLHPYPHNLLINELYKENKSRLNLDKLEELPTIDDDVAILYYDLMQSLLDEIGQSANNPIGFTVGSWKYWDAKNAANKTKHFINTKDKFDTTKTNYFKTYKRLFSGNIEGNTFNLLEGLDSALASAESESERLYVYEQLIYNNVHKLLEKEYTLTQILDNSNISRMFSPSDNDSLLQQFTCEINEKIKLKSLTPMDKFNYLLTLICTSASDYNKELLKSLTFTDTAPVAPLQYVSRMGIAYSRNTALYNEGIEWLKSKVVQQYGANQVLIYGQFITGNGGAGKTSVVLRDIVNSVDGKVLAVAPTQGLLKGFDKLPSLAQAIVKEELWKQILDGDINVIAATDSMKLYEKGYQIEKVARANPDTIKSKFKKVDDLKMICIDEATHYSTFELSVLSEYCKFNNIPLILVGDDLQNGYHQGDYPNNINMECCFVSKTPRLTESIRSANYQKQENNNILALLVLRSLSTPTDKELREQFIQDTLTMFQSFKLRYYDGSAINGDMIVNSLSDEQYLKLYGKTIGFLGNENSPKALELKAKLSGKAKSIVFVNDPVALQGQEFDVMISEYDLPTADLTGGNLEEIDSKLRKFLRMFYTISTRGKEATIFFNTNNLQNAIKNRVQEFYLNTNTNFSQESFTMFLDQLKDFLLKTSKFSSLTISETTTPETSASETTTSEPSASGAVLSTGGKINTPIKLTSDVQTTATSEASNSDKETVSRLIRNSYNEDNELFELDVLDILDENLGTMMGFGDFSLRGVGADINKETGETRWILEETTILGSDGQNHLLLQDCGLFMHKTYGCEGTNVGFGNPLYGNFEYGINTGENKRDYVVSKLMLLKGAILFGMAESAYPEEFRNHFDIKSAKYKVIAEKRNKVTDRFVGYSDLDNNQMAMKINNDAEELVYKVVVEYTNSEGDVYRVTLGGLANPITYEKSLTKLAEIKENLEKRLKYLNTLVKTEKVLHEINNLNNRIKRLDVLQKTRPLLVEDYKRLIQSIYDNYKKGLTETEISDIKFDYSTGIRTIELAGDNDLKQTLEIQKVRVSGFLKYLLERIINQNELNTEKDSKNKDYERRNRVFDNWFVDEVDLKRLRTFRSKNPYVKMSNVYIVNLSEESSSYMGGKAVVFMSTNGAFTSDYQLITQYKEEQELNKTLPVGKRRHSVRMIHLDNMGCSLAQLCDSHAFGFIARTNTDRGGGFNKFPADTRYMGARMLISLWNFRANLKNYKELYKTKKEIIFGNASESEIEQYLKDMYTLYQAYKKEKNLENENLTNQQDLLFYSWALENCNKYGLSITKEIVKNINTFNTDTTSKVRQFRLGTGDNNDWNIRKIFGAESGMYKEGENPYGIYMSPVKMNQWDVMLDDIWKALNNVVKLKHKVLNPDGSETYENYDILSNININDLNIQEVLVKDPNSLFTFEEDTHLEDTSLIKFIPKIITSIASRAIAYSKTEERVNTVNGTKERWLSAEEDAEKRPWTNRSEDLIWDWTKAGIVKFNETKKGQESVKHIIPVLGLVSNGEDIAKLFDLIFHGTTDDFIQAIDSHHFTPQATDAFFKQGFLIDPFAEVGAYGNPIEIPGFGKLIKCQTNLGFFGIKCSVTLPTFKIKLTGKFEENENIDTKEPIKPQNYVNSLNDIFNGSSIDKKIDLLENSDEEELKQIDIYSKAYNKLKTKLKDEFDGITITKNYNTIIFSSGGYYLEIDADGNFISEEIKETKDSKESFIETQLQKTVKNFEDYLLNGNFIQNVISDEKKDIVKELFFKGTSTSIDDSGLSYFEKEFLKSINNVLNEGYGDIKSFKDFINSLDINIGFKKYEELCSEYFNEIYNLYEDRTLLSDLIDFDINEEFDNPDSIIGNILINLGLSYTGNIDEVNTYENCKFN